MDTNAIFFSAVPLSTLVGGNPYNNFSGNPHTAGFPIIRPGPEEPWFPGAFIGRNGRLFTEGTEIICYHPTGQNARGTAVSVNTQYGPNVVVKLRQPDGSVPSSQGGGFVAFSMCWNPRA
jgi:hypothetical protein